MWITAWILAASATFSQPTYPPFYTQADCELARQVYLRNRMESTASCIQVKIFANVQR